MKLILVAKKGTLLSFQLENQNILIDGDLDMHDVEINNLASPLFYFKLHLALFC